MLQPRADGARSALNVLLTARQRIDSQRIMNRNALNVLVREIDLGIDARKTLNDRQDTEISRWRQHPTDLVEQRYAREEADRLAIAEKEADRQLKENKKELSSMGEELAPCLQSQPGFGPVTVGAIIVAYSHHGRIHSESAFAAMAGTTPIQASSGNTVRHRLYCYGDRRLNQALDAIAKVRMRSH